MVRHYDNANNKDHWQAPALADMLHLGVRFYEPEVGRFGQRDPIRDGLNWYAYANGGPTDSVDPTGRSAYENMKAGICAGLCSLKYGWEVKICNTYSSLKGPYCLAAAAASLAACTYGCYEGVDYLCPESWWVTGETLWGVSTMGFGYCKKVYYMSSQGRHAVCTFCQNWNAYSGSWYETFGPNTPGYGGKYGLNCLLY